ncbi:imidazole glycerol phosphate synthase subunit hisF, partial [mine drainage metagenome]
GADKVAINSAALQDPTLLRRAADEHGSQCVVAAVDVRRTDASWAVFSEAGRRPTGRDALAWCQEAADLGAGELLVTSVDRDGTGAGYDRPLYERLRARLRVPIVASGGCGTAEDVVALFRSGSADGALLASRLHTGGLRLGEIRAAMRSAGLPDPLRRPPRDANRSSCRWSSRTSTADGC